MDVIERTEAKVKEEAAKVEGVEGMFREGATGRLTGRATWASAMWISQTRLFQLPPLVCFLCRFVLL